MFSVPNMHIGCFFQQEVEDCFIVFLINRYKIKAFGIIGLVETCFLFEICILAVLFSRKPSERYGFSL